MANGEVDWNRLDKRKFFGYGVGMFSGVTTLLYPLAVIKTRQMALPGVAPGFRGTGQTISSMWRLDGVRGFYSGYSTVVFGTVPARVLYLSSLEVSKSTIGTIGREMELSEPTVAGVSNFVGGAAASLATQSVAVPLDVISQRQMVYSGMHPRGGAARGPPPPPPPPPPGAASAGASAATAARSAGVAAASPSPASSAVPSPAAAAAGVASPLHPSAAPGGGVLSTANAPAATHGHAGAPSSSGVGSSTSTTGGSKAALSTASRARASVRPPPLSLLPSTSAAFRLQATATAAAATGRPQRPSGYHIFRTIIAAEGFRGLYRGFGVSVATFVPSSAVWWAAYGTYQSLIWRVVAKDEGSAAVAGSSTAAADASADAPWSQVLKVQVAASVGAGLTSAVFTNPLDLIKTRIQVSEQEQGLPPNFRRVLGQIIAEDGMAGLWRGVLPRMANGALWGTCMVSVYEFLKRISSRTDAEMAALEYERMRLEGSRLLSGEKSR